ncbi:hypothetical protein [Massilia sp. Leaf139]|uniref:hypothetical protein n=1 Tax=Massilia sp. Leaf139 TaxID=1736272 RepID=UPI0006F2EDAD|nr:hypothetical protein [Massilia sp. Leaf139]KQQ89210.1 hypothetical protein ASF77_11125 [Massilia sp. Leaf139]
MKLKRFEYAVAVAVMALVAGCGGGGGGGGGGGTTPPPPAGGTPPVTPVTEFTLGGTVSGLGAGASVTLANGSESLPVNANGAFTFATKLKAGTAYDIKVTPPAGYTCKATNNTGTMESANSTKAVVDCAPVVLAGVRGTLQEPLAVAGDASGNVYVLDGGLHGILKMNSAGQISTFAGGSGQPGLSDGAGAAARFWLGGNGAAVDAQGNLFVADSCNGAIRKLTSAGTVTTLAGSGTAACYNVASAGVTAKVDGVGTAAKFAAPQSLVADGQGGVIVLDASAGLSIRRVSASGVVTTQTYVHPDPSLPAFSLQTLARANDGTLYLSDSNNRIWKDVGGRLVAFAGTFVGSGSQDGTGTAARFSVITSMVTTPNGDLYVTDVASVRKVTPAGVVTTLAGSATQRGQIDAQGTAARFGNLLSIGFDGTSLFVIDSGQEVLRKVALDGTVTTPAATPAVRATTDGNATTARFGSFSSLAADADGNLYFVDPVTHVLRKSTPNGTVSTISGTTGEAGLTDGPLASAKFAGPQRVATGRDGSIWVAQVQGLRRIKDGIVSTVDANVRPVGLTIDANGNAIVTTGATGGEVLRFTPTGARSVLVQKPAVVALAGANANFIPQSVAVDAAGNIYIADTGTVAVYKLTPSGTLSVFAGTPLKETGNVDGAVNTATLGFYEVDHMTIDDAGNLYLSGSGNVRMISPAGVVSTPSYVWGNASIGAVTYNKGKLYGMTRYAVMQTYL